MICSRRSLQKSDREQIALIALYKRATASKLLTTQERLWAIRSRRSLKKTTKSDSLRWLFTKEQQEQISIFREQIALLLTKTIDLLKKPKSKFLTLQHSFLYGK